MSATFVIRRNRKDGVKYLTPSGGWSPEMSQAEKFSERIDAMIKLRGRQGNIIRCAEKADQQVRPTTEGRR